MPPVGAYSQRLRNCIVAQTHRVILEFWANDIDITYADWITMGYVDDPGSMTACHHVADTLIARAGTGGLTTVVSGTDNMAPAIQNIRDGGYIMEIKFATDHSVCLISTLADPYVEIIEGWAGAGPAAYMFFKSVYDDHDRGRILKDTAADALDQIVQGNNLAGNVGRLTRAPAGDCGIHKDPFIVTVKYDALDNINAFALAAQLRITRYTEEVSELVYRVKTLAATTTGLRCRRCYKEKPSWRITQGYWHICATCSHVYCDGCGAHRPRPVGQGYFADWTRTRQCLNGHTMTMS